MLIPQIAPISYLPPYPHISLLFLCLSQNKKKEKLQRNKSKHKSPTNQKCREANEQKGKNK